MRILNETGTGSHAVYAYYFPSQKQGERWPVKVGHAKDPMTRIRRQQASMQEEPVIMHIHWTDSPYWAEQTVHSRLKDHKLPTFGKEWFNTNNEEIGELLYTPAYVQASLVRGEVQLGQTIRTHRTRKGMTQTQLGESVGLRTATISSLENGGPCKLDTVFKVMAFLNLEFHCTSRTVGPDIEEIF